MKGSSDKQYSPATRISRQFTLLPFAKWLGVWRCVQPRAAKSQSFRKLLEF
jgi:hypothetical protein